MNQLKRGVFYNYFEKRVVHYPVSRNGQNVSAYLHIKDGRLIKHYEGLKNKYKFKRSEFDLQSEYIFQSWSAIERFDSEDWDGLLNQTNTHEEMKLLKYIRSHTSNRMNEFVNPNTLRTTTMNDDGVRIHKSIIVEFESLDRLLNNPVEDTMGLQLTDKHNVFNTEMYEYYVTYFQKWYRENKEDILTESQLGFMENLERHAGEPLTGKNYHEITGKNWKHFRRDIERVSTRITNAWNKAKPKTQSRRQLAETPKISFLKEYMDIVKDTRKLDMQNLKLTNHLVKGMNDDKVELEVFDITNSTLKGDQLIEFNRIVNNNNFNGVSLSAPSLYLLTDAIKQRLESLLEAQEREEPVKEESTEAIEPQKKTEYTTIYTYDKNGVLIGSQRKIIKDYTKSGNIYFLTPTGALVDRV